MSQQMPCTVSSWETPFWATKTTMDELAIDYSHIMGTLADQPGRAQMSVMAIQRDDLSSGPSGCTVRRMPAEIMIAGERVTVSEARDFADWLKSVIDLVGGSNINT